MLQQPQRRIGALNALAQLSSSVALAALNFIVRRAI